MQAGVDEDIGVPDAVDMRAFPKPEHSIDAVWAAGLEIGRGMQWPERDDGPEADYIREVFRVAHNWRESHGLPLRRVRAKLMGRVRHTGVEAFTAARVKRMASIRPKLAKGLGLHIIQDLGGCRCVAEDYSQMQRLLEAARGIDCFNVLREDNYIADPKKSGYRSHHVIVSYRAQESEEAYDGLNLEIQFRTELQHTWATANESVGLYKGQNFKGGKGDVDWLRFFTLMSAEIADMEQLPEGRKMPERGLRQAEIRDLADRLRASELLSACAQAFREMDVNHSPTETPTYWLIIYHAARQEVEVQPYFTLSGFEAYERAERLGQNAVLIDGTKFKSLRREFPNYFGDVRLFQGILARITGGLDTSHFVIKSNRERLTREREKPDPSILYPQRGRRWTDK